MSKKRVIEKPEHVSGEQFGAIPHIYKFHNLEFGKDNIVAGTKVRFKNRRGVFTFRSMYHNSELDVQWRVPSLPTSQVMPENISLVRSPLPCFSMASLTWAIASWS